MNNKRGFTLVELLAVIVILAIILAIAIPGISNVINNATKGAFESDAKLLLSAINYKIMEDDSFDPTSINETNVSSVLGLGDTNYESLTVKRSNGKIIVTIVGKNKWSNLTVSGTKSVTNVTNTVTALSNGANKPVLATNMVPIKWVDGACVEGVCAEGTWEDTIETDTAWYNYDTTNKRWANARTVDGSMWVWIPRYIYMFPTDYWGSNNEGTINIQFTKGIDDNWNKGVIGNIDLGETANASNNKWTNHPAFTFGDTELTGIWVAKFEASNDGSNNVKVVPDVPSWRGMSVNDIFNKVRSMETNNIYGWGLTGSNIDSHMMKSIEWGVVTYLSHSAYGKNTEIRINNSSDFITGCAGNSISEASYPGCQNAYDTEYGKLASTTANIYGIYDMSGGTWEFMASYINNGHANLKTFGSSIINANHKYKDVYEIGITDVQATNYAQTINHKGDAVYETSDSSTGASSWYSDYSYMPRLESPWFGRGGSNGSGIRAGTFNFFYFTGDQGVGFRPVILVGPGL